MQKCKVRELRTGHKVEEISEEDFKRITQDFPMYDGIVRLQPGGWFVTNYTPELIEQIYDFEFKPTDTLVITYPKSGTTWMQEIVWTLLHNPDLNNPKAEIVSDIRSPHIEMDNLLMPRKVPKLEDIPLFMEFFNKIAPGCSEAKYKNLTLLKHLEGPRVIKSHLPLELFPPSMLQTAKLIYVARDPRDVIASKESFFRYLVPHSYQGTLDAFVDYFINEEQYLHPYWPHVKAAYNLRNQSNVLFMYFEDLKKNPTREVIKISKFLGLDTTPQQIENVVEHSNFLNMKKRTEGKENEALSGNGVYLKKAEDGTGAFFRKGAAGSWKSSFTETQVNKITKWMDENMKFFDDSFPYKNRTD